MEIRAWHNRPVMSWTKRTRLDVTRSIKTNRFYLFEKALFEVEEMLPVHRRDWSEWREASHGGNVCLVDAAAGDCVFFRHFVVQRQLGVTFRKLSPTKSQTENGHLR